MSIRASELKVATALAQEWASPEAVHCEESEYATFLESLPVTPHHRQMRMLWRDRFVERWPQLSDWFQEPLRHRLGRRPGESYKNPVFKISHEAKSYLCYLALTDRLRLDYPYLLGHGALHAFDVASILGIDWKTEELQRIGDELGYKAFSVNIALRWGIPRIAMHTGARDLTTWTDVQLDELGCAIRAFRQRPISSKRTDDRPATVIWPSALHVLRVLLHHRGNTVTLPRRLKPVATSLSFGAPTLREPAERWLGIKAAGWSFRTTQHQRVSLNHFLRHLDSSAESAHDI